MRIAFDAKRAFHNTRGLGNYSRDTLRIVSEYLPGNDYLLLNPAKKNSIPLQLPENCRQIFPNDIIGKALPSFWRSAGVCRDLKQLKPDIYHGLSQELPFGIHKTGIPTVVTMHDAIFMRYPELYSASYRNIFIQKNKYACKVASRILAISEQTKQDIVNYFDAEESRIDVVYQGCNPVFRIPVSEEQKAGFSKKYALPETFILTVGAIERRKNAVLIVEALAQQKLDIPLVIAGRPTEYVQSLKKRIEELGIQSQVLFLENVSTDDLPVLYTLASVFVLPSFFEGFGIPVLEALCCGTPVIASTGSCFEETGGAFSRYVDPNQPEELGTVLQELLSDQEKRTTMRIEGLKYAQNFTDESIARQLSALYSKTIL